MLTSFVRTIIFYRARNGDCPVENFLDSLPSRHAKKVTWVLGLIETLDRVPIQYFKKLDGTTGIWEVRVDFGSDTLRLLGFLHKGDLVVLTNGFAKKSQKTPPSEIETAERRKLDYLERGKP